MAAVSKAVSSALDGAGETQHGQSWPGAITPGEHNVGGYGDHSVTDPALPSGRSPDGAQPGNPVLGEIGYADPAGGIAGSDTGWPSHALPAEPWASSAGDAFAPSGPVGPVHETEIGSPEPQITPETGYAPYVHSDSQSYAPAWSWDSLTGRRDKTSAPRVARDDFHGAGSQIDYRPRWADVVLRPFRHNIASTAQPLNPVGDVQGVQGALPQIVRNADDRSILYQPPPDPSVTQSGATASGPYSISGLW